MAGTGSRRRHRGRRKRATLLAAAWLACGAAAPAEEAPEAQAPARAPYEAAGPSERRGRSFDVDEMQAESAEPSFGGRTRDLEQHVGEARPVGELSRRPGPKPVDPAAPAEEIPAPLRLRRTPGEAPAAGDPLVARLCEAELEHAHAGREFRSAVRAYKRARRDEYPRGDAKALVVQRRALAGKRMERAAQARELLLGEAAEQELAFDPASCAALGSRLQVGEDREELAVQPGLHGDELEPEEARDRERPE
jgi:hypothetical protein